MCAKEMKWWFHNHCPRVLWIAIIIKSNAVCIFLFFLCLYSFEGNMWVDNYTR